MKPTARYASASRPTSDDPREVEAWALAEAARRLIDASRDPDDYEALQGALQLNQRLWTIFQAAITEDDCVLPSDLRTNIAALSLLVDRETIARLADLDVSKLETLININRNVSSGLYQKVEGAPVAVPNPADAVRPQNVPMDQEAPPAAAQPPRPQPPQQPAFRPPGAAQPQQPAEAPKTLRESLRISI